MRPRLAVLLTRSISTRLLQLLSYKQIALQSPQISFFVSKRLRTLSFSVSCKSCVCHSCENWRVCTNNSRFGSHLALIPEKIGPFFSCTYVEPILQPFCFQIHACNGGGCIPPWLSLSQARSPRPQIPSPIPFLFKFLRTLLRFFALIKNSTLFFSSISALFAQNRGCGVLWLTRLPIRESVLPAPTLSGSISGRSIATEGVLFHGPRNTDHDSPWLHTSLLRYFITSSLPPASDLSPTGLTRPTCRRRRKRGTFRLPRRRGRTERQQGRTACHWLR